MKGYHEGQRSLLAWLWPGLAALSLLCSGENGLHPDEALNAVRLPALFNALNTPLRSTIF